MSLITLASNLSGGERVELYFGSFRRASSCCHFREGNFNPTFFISRCGSGREEGGVVPHSLPPLLYSDDDIKVIINNRGPRMPAINPHRPFVGCSTGL
ncbi:hypothetical protein CDAR_292221 [Caerostris darwini]|uniref:Uncharacterized protein n=1 Tax=Caerostris darwini TaxID=1538125 RepID=A0AAV4VPM1_9ARAC|nr:hypothetical protein CDAR_292221 [Caerostris darwini]